MADIRVGKPDTKVDAPAHMKGVSQGNESGGIENNDPGFYSTGERGAGRPSAKSTARRSTGIGPKRHDPILPIMPNRPPG